MSKYEAPPGPPPSYATHPQAPAPTHQDASGASAAYYNESSDPRGMANYGSPAPGQQQYYPPQQGGYPPQQGYAQGPYGQPPPQGGYYPQQGQPMYAPQQGYYQQPPPGGRQSSGGEGICAGIAAALACCCCLDILF